MINKIQPVNLLHIASGDLWAGAEVQLLTLVRTLFNNNDVKVSVILLNHGTLEKKLRNIGISVYIIDESKLNPFQILISLIRLIHNIHPNVIHTHRIKENIFGSISALVNGCTTSLRSAHGAPEHRPAWNQVPKKLILFLDWFCGRFLQKKIIAVSEDLASILRKSYPSNKIVVIENGIEIKELTLLKKSSKIKKQKKTTFKVGIAGRLVPIKRVDIFIKTAQYMMKTFPEHDIHFHIFGDGPLQEDLIQISKKLKTEDIVHFEGHSNNLPQDLLTLNALLMTSDHEGLPMTLLEAMTLHIPVIAHAVGGIPTLLDNGNCGILIEKHEARIYAQAIFRLINDDEFKTKLTQQAFERINRRYSADDNADRYLIEYNSIR